jgi:hypothetical protein
MVDEPLAASNILKTLPSPAVGGTTTGDGTFPESTQVTVVATPNDDYGFISWTYINGLEASKLATYTFAITNSTTLVANFEVRHKRKLFNLVKLTQCDAESMQQRPVWLNPDHVLYVILRDDGTAHVHLRDAKTMFVVEAPELLRAMREPRS